VNRDDILRMAREVILKVSTNISGITLVGAPSEYGLAHLTIDELERFAALVEQHLLQQGYRKCAKGQRTTQFCGMLEDAVKAEREACARVCEVHYDKKRVDFTKDPYITTLQCAAAIRARGEGK